MKKLFFVVFIGSILSMHGISANPRTANQEDIISVSADTKPREAEVAKKIAELISQKLLVALRVFNAHNKDLFKKLIETIIDYVGLTKEELTILKNDINLVASYILKKTVRNNESNDEYDIELEYQFQNILDRWGQFINKVQQHLYVLDDAERAGNDLRLQALGMQIADILKMTLQVLDQRIQVQS